MDCEPTRILTVRGREYEVSDASISAIIAALVFPLLLTVFAVLVVAVVLAFKFWQVTICLIVATALSDRVLKVSGRKGFYQATRDPDAASFELNFSKEAFQKRR